MDINHYNLQVLLQKPFRAIHFALKTSGDEVRICIWRSLDDTVKTFKELMPDFRSDITTDDIRVLAMPDWSGYYADEFAYDEYAALWLAQVVYYSSTVIPAKLADCYDEVGAVRHASSLLKNPDMIDEDRLPFGVPKWISAVRKMLTGSFESYYKRAIFKPNAVGSFVPSPGACWYCLKTHPWDEK